MIEQRRPLMPEDLDEREAERRARQEYVKRARAESLTGTRLESREQRSFRVAVRCFGLRESLKIRGRQHDSSAACESQ